jgi:hypothetical protein
VFCVVASTQATRANHARSLAYDIEDVEAVLTLLWMGDLMMLWVSVVMLLVGEGKS